MIVFDLEWNSGMYDHIPLNEIIQIGAVKVAGVGGPILDTFNAYIKPTVHKRYSPGVAKLPELSLCECSQLDFRTAIADFARWCGEDTSFAAWGDGDFGVLKQNLAWWKADFPIPATYLDLQAAFGATVGAKGHLALHYAVEYCQIPDVFGYHNSMYDALYTALVSPWIDPAQLEPAVRVPGQPTSQRERPTAGLPKGRQWMGPFPERALLFNNRGCRLAVCPTCGRRVRVGQWRVVGAASAFARFSCPDHGPFLLRLDVARDKKSRLWGATRVLPPDAPGVPDLNGAPPFTCKGRKRSTRRRRRRRRSEPQASEQADRP